MKRYQVTEGIEEAEAEADQTESLRERDVEMEIEVAGDLEEVDNII